MSLFCCTVRRRSCAAVTCRSRSRIAGAGLLPPLAPSSKKGVPAFGPPREGFGLLPGLLHGGEQGAGQGFHGQAVCAEVLDQFAELGGFLRLDLLGLVHEGLKFGVEVVGLGATNLLGT